MTTKTKIILTTIAAGTLAFLANGGTPLGRLLWPPAPGMPTLDGAPLAMFMTVGILEAISLGAGVSFLVWGWPHVARAGASPGVARAAYLAIAWLLMSGVPHDNLHAHYGENFLALGALGLAFHATTGIAGAAVAAFVIQAGRARAARAHGVSQQDPVAA